MVLVIPARSSAVRIAVAASAGAESAEMAA